MALKRDVFEVYAFFIKNVSLHNFLHTHVPMFYLFARQNKLGCFTQERIFNQVGQQPIQVLSIIKFLA